MTPIPAALASAQDATPHPIEVLAPDGSRCVAYGMDGKGRAECYWPTCGCTPAAREQAFLDLALGVPETKLVKAMKTLTGTRIGWRGVPRTDMAKAFASGFGCVYTDALMMKGITIEQLREALSAVCGSPSRVATPR